MKGTLKGRKEKGILLLAFLLSAALFMTGCGGSSRSTEGEMAVAEETMAAVSMDSGAAMPREVSRASMGGSGGSALLNENEAASALEDSTTSGDGEASAETVSERKLIRTIDLNVQTRAFDELLKSIDERVSELGGYIEYSDQSGAEGYTDGRYANITVRMPAENTDEFLDTALESAVIVYRSESTEDVTLRYTDMEARMEALRVEQERLTELLSEADSIESVIAIESRLSEVRYEVESIESQLRSYDNRISYDTITISINEVDIIESGGRDSFTDRVRTGFAKNLSGLGRSLEDLAVFLIINLPLFLIIAVFAVLIYIIVRKIRKRNVKPDLPLPEHKDDDRDRKVTASDAGDDKGGKA